MFIKKKTTVNTMAASALVTQGIEALVDMMFTLFLWNIPYPINFLLSALGVELQKC